MPASSCRRYLAVWLRRLATDRLTRSRSHAPADAPLVVVAPVKGALRLAAVNDAAARLGLAPGLAFADARARYPNIAAADADAAADARMLAAIADWCDRYTPLIGLDPPDGLLLDITGCAHLFGGEDALHRDIVMRLARQGFQARAAVAETVGCAWAVARYSTRTLVPSSRTRDALLPLPLAALRIPAETISGLAQVGLTIIGDVIERPRAPLAARFGEMLLRRLDQALGREDESISPRLPLPAFVTERRFAEPVARDEDVLGTIEHLAHELARLLERRGEGARILEVALFRTDGKVHRIAAGTGTPLREPARIRALFVERLAAIGDECDPGFGYDVIRLGALATDRCDPAQTGLAAPDHAAELAHLIDRLGARFGLRRVMRLEAHDTHIPEFAVRAVAAAAATPNSCAAPASEWRSRASQPPLSRLPVCAAQDSLAPTRPIRLLEKAEPVEAIAEVPDGPPVRFTWRRVPYVVAVAEGPERIALPWWCDAAGRKLTRDYFRVECRDGVRVWLYREGFFSGPIPPQWFVQGVFA